MRKTLTMVAVALALSAGGIAAANYGDPKQPPPPPPPWVDPATGLVMPGFTAEVVDSNGDVVVDCVGNPIRVPVGVPPAPGSGTAIDDGLPDWVPTIAVGGAVVDTIGAESTAATTGRAVDGDAMDRIMETYRLTGIGPPGCVP